jgi:hypothetical protein
MLQKQLIKSNETSATSPNTLKTYVTTLRLLKIFVKVNGTFDFKDINLSWYQNFTEWCNSNKNYNPSTIGKHIGHFGKNGLHSAFKLSPHSALK